MYLTESDGVALLQHVVDRFPSGELQIDFYNWLAVTIAEDAEIERQSGSTLYWAVNEPQDILDRVSGVAVADRRDVLRREHLRPGVGCLPVGETSGSCGPAAAPNTAIPPLRLRARQLTPVAACCSAMAQSSERIASIDFSGAGPCEWYSTFNCPANIWVK